MPIEVNPQPPLSKDPNEYISHPRIACFWMHGIDLNEVQRQVVISHDRRDGAGHLVFKVLSVPDEGQKDTNKILKALLGVDNMSDIDPSLVDKLLRGADHSQQEYLPFLLREVLGSSERVVERVVNFY